MRSKRTIALHGFVAFALAYIVYQANKGEGVLPIPFWNTIWWILLTFNSLVLSFSVFNSDFQASKTYYMSLMGAQQFVAYIFIRQLVVQLLVIGLCVCILSILFPLKDNYSLANLLIASGVGVFSLSASTLIGGLIGSKTVEGGLLTLILSLPFCIPTIIFGCRSTKAVLDDLDPIFFYESLLPLCGFSLLPLALVLILYPTLWKN